MRAMLRPPAERRTLGALAALGAAALGGVALDRSGALTRPGGGPAAHTVRGRPGGIGRAATRAGDRLSDELRLGGGALLGARRRSAALSLVAVGAMSMVSLYQLGVIRRLPEPPLGIFDAEAVDAAGEAYGRLSSPDAVLGLGSYALTLALAAAGGVDRAERHPWLPAALALKVVADAVSGGVLTLEQATKHRSFCFWCLLAAMSSVASVPQVIPEVRAALAARG